MDLPPQLETVGRTDLKEGDMIVVRLDRPIHGAAYDRIHDVIFTALPASLKDKVTILILDAGMSLEVFRKAA